MSIQTLSRRETLYRFDADMFPLSLPVRFLKNGDSRIMRQETYTLEKRQRLNTVTQT